MKTAVKDALIVVLVFAAIAVACAFSGCTTQRKATDWMNGHPEQAAEYCANKFPVKDTDSTVSDTTKKAENKDYGPYIDSLQGELKKMEEHMNALIASGENDVDVVQSVLRKEILKLQQQLKELKAKADKLQADYKPCLPDTIETTIYKYRENTAKVAQLQLQIERMQKQTEAYLKKIEALEQSRDGWRKWCLILATVIVLYILMRIFSARIPFKVV